MKKKSHRVISFLIEGNICYHTFSKSTELFGYPINCKELHSTPLSWIVSHVSQETLKKDGSFLYEYYMDQNCACFL